ALTDTLGFEFPTYTALLTYNMPIGNRTANNAERTARAQVRLSQVDLDNISLSVEAEVRGAVRSVFFAAEQVNATATSLELAQRQLEAEQARAKEGLSTTFEVLQFQQDLIEAMSNEANARAGFVMSLSALDNAQGIIGETARSTGGGN
ncbi:MAG: TolC family protein, partial [Planctomycetota bacterium]